MVKRDKLILEHINKFRCMTRDHVAELFFHGKYKINGANAALKRLRREGYIKANTNRLPYVYFPGEASINMKSQKIEHYLSIVDFYVQLCKFEKPIMFDVEPKFEKGMPEPDVCMKWKKENFFVEIQRAIYSERNMDEKVRRYERIEDKFYLWIITDKKYSINKYSFPVFQSKNVNELMLKIR